MTFGGVIHFNKKGYVLLCIIILTLLFYLFSNKESPQKSDEISLLSLLETAIQAAEAGGQLVVSVKGDLKIESKGKTLEGMEDSVTTADFLSHCAMVTIIRNNFPSVKIISEEADTQCEKENQFNYVEKPGLNTLPDELVKSEDVTVWIDPLDATHEYAEKLYEYVTTMVCVAVNGNPVIGVIHNPFIKNTSWAFVGKGYSNDLRTTGKKKHEKSKIIISRSHSGAIKEVLDKNFNNFQLVVAAGAGFKALKVAKGEVDAYLHITAIKKWDICAGNAILNALGGQMTTKYNKKLSYYNETDVVNKDGLIATLKNHDRFVNKL